MKKITTLFLFTFSSIFLLAQTDSVIQKEIDEQVWYPFIKYYESWDAVNFRKIHTDDMLRGTPWGLKSGKEYHAGNVQKWAERKAKGWEKDIAFTFEYRVVGEDVAYEVGYYKLKSKRDGKEAVYYGQFHVVHRKENGVWKIAQDWDTDEINGQKIGEEEFMKYADKGIYQ